MKLNPLGKTSIAVSEIGLGTWELSGDVWGKKDDDLSLKAIHTAIDSGVNFIDTAAGYGKGHAETLIGTALRQSVKRDSSFPPKCCRNAANSLRRQIRKSTDFYPPDWIVSQCEASLKRLQVDHIGILFLHTWSRAWGHRTEWADALAGLKQQGKIRTFGISIPDEGITDANVHIEAGRVDVIQCVYNIFQQEPEYSLFPLARKHGVGIIARSPFSSGALIGDWTSGMGFPDGDWRASWPRSVKPNWLEEQVEMAAHVRRVLEPEGIPMPTAAIRYVLATNDVASVIPGSANPKHVYANVCAVPPPQLPTSVINSLKRLWAEGKIRGTYNGSI